LCWLEFVSMLEPFTFIKCIRDAQNDPNWPVLMEIEKRRPGFRREQTLGVIGLFLISALLLFCLLMGWEVPF
jgi:hypothetical protein